VSKKSIKSDLARVDRMKDAEIDYSDIPPLDKSFFTKATEAWPPAKQQLTIRLDADVLNWLRANGRGYPPGGSGMYRRAGRATDGGFPLLNVAARVLKNCASHSLTVVHISPSRR
jgi:uncharacterized protein (DUF4415 family)